jgi:hypothetical protein
MIDPAWQEWMENGPAVLVASGSRDGIIDCVRGIGLRIEGVSALRLLFNGVSAQRLVENTRAGSWVAATVTQVMLFRSLQFKGPAEVVPVEPEDVEHVRVYRDRFLRHVAQVFGASLQKPYERLRAEAEVCVRLQVREVYDQSPGRGAGRAVVP